MVALCSSLKTFRLREVDCCVGVSIHDTAALASLVTVSLIPVSFAVGRELLKYLKSAILTVSATKTIVESCWAGLKLI